MNPNQKRIIIAMITIIVAMLLWPPFQVDITTTDNHLIYNEGYSWFLDPPTKNTVVPATVNISMLLIQWIGVLVVGGLALFLAKGQPD